MVDEKAWLEFIASKVVCVEQNLDPKVREFDSRVENARIEVFNRLFVGDKDGRACMVQRVDDL